MGSCLGSCNAGDVFAILTRQDGHTDTLARFRIMTEDEKLAMLTCPMGKKPLQRVKDDLVCTYCGTRFAIENGIPNMLIEEAKLPEGCASIAELKCVASGEVRYDG